MVILRQYKAADMMSVLAQGARQPGMPHHTTVAELAKLKESKGPAVTAVIEERVVGCAGLEIPWPGVAEIWCVFVDDIDRYTMQLGKVIRPLIRQWREEHNLVRIQTPLRVDFPEGIRLAQWAGFKLEGKPMRKYHPDHSDALMYVMVGD